MDAQDNQGAMLLRERLTPAMIVRGLADVSGCKPTVSRKILCILCIHIDKPSTLA